MNILKQLWRDELGGMYSAELVLVGAILLIGVAPGIVLLRNAVVVELSHFAKLISNSDRRYDDDSDDDKHHHKKKPILTAKKLLED